MSEASLYNLTPTKLSVGNALCVQGLSFVGNHQTGAVAGHSFLTQGKAQGDFLLKHADESAMHPRKECSGKLIITRARSKTSTPFYTL